MLDLCEREDIGISITKPLASRTLKTVVGALDADWSGSSAVRERCLKYLVGECRVQLINVGMRWEHEVVSHSRLFSGMPVPRKKQAELSAMPAIQ